MRNHKESIFGYKVTSSIFTFVICLVMMAGQTSAQIRNGDPKGGRQPEWTSTWTGPFTCEAVNASTATDVAHITTDNELRLNYTPPSASDSFTYTTASGSKPRVLVGTADTGNTMTTVNSSGTSLNWTSTKAIGAVLVGGSSSNRLYWMPEGMALGTQFSGTGFQNPNGSTITKVAFCYHEPATVTIIKEVQSASGFSTVSFPFSSTNLGTSTNMSLVDNNSIGPDRKITSNLYKFAKWGDYNITVTESLTQFWSLTSLSCVETDTILVPAQTQYATTVDFSARKATIRLEEGENVTCTYKNTSQNPTAAVGSISGRVTDSYGNGIAGARVMAVNGSLGLTNAVRSNSSGYYSFNDLPVAEFYLLTVEHKSYSFAESTRTFTLSEDLVGLDFTANP